MNKTHCNAIRGLAIAGIFLHNYCHWLGGVVRENEYTFNGKNASALWHAFEHPDELLPLHILSFFGHYGVPLFLFLSAYGLEKKYASLPERIGVARFLASHYRKLFVMMAVGFTAFTMVDLMTPGAYHYTFVNVLAQLTMLNNLLPEPEHAIWPGPYWFLGLMWQLYLIYRLLIYRRHWAVVAALMLTAWLLQAMCEPASAVLNQLRYNAVGSLLPFGLGVLYARYERSFSRLTNAWLCLFSAIAVFVASFNYHSWLFAPAFVCLFGISWVRILPQQALKSFAVAGCFSAALFVCHPLARKVFIPISRQGDVYAGLLLYILASCILAVIFKEIIAKLSQALPSKV